MNNTQHTPLPWKATTEKSWGKEREIKVVIQGGVDYPEARTIALTTGGGYCRPHEPEFFKQSVVDENAANAALIVRAVNNHASLVRACEAALAYLCEPASEFAENRAAAEDIIRDAIAAAKGEN